MKTGIYGMIRMSSLDDDIAKAAKAAGGDAVILTNEGEQVIGVANSETAAAYANGGPGWANSTGFGTGYTRPIKNHQARYVVVRYLPEEPGAPQAPVQPPAQQGQAAQLHP